VARQVLLRGPSRMSSSDTAMDVAALYEAESKQLERFFFHRLRDHEIARDLTGETYLRVLSHSDQFVGHPEDGVRWLYGIARHVLGDHRRRRDIADAALLRLPTDRVVDAEDEHHRVLTTPDRRLQHVLAATMRRLPEAQRRALALRVVDELPYDEVALHLGVESTLARARVSRALAALAAAVAAAGL
jgi:RNA polymerase sigma factor (sigma-70 family)